MVNDGIFSSMQVKQISASHLRVSSTSNFFPLQTAKKQNRQPRMGIPAHSNLSV